MQQPIYQDQQGGQQGAGQQMLLCPVRLVYETQILVQPGEQIQPNQTIFINPHNPPPWIQNRPQNNVMYVQQMAPNNFMPQIQQQPAQNPIYIHQNYNNLQQMIPQQIISQAQHKEVRTANVQMANMLQRNPAQQLQPTANPYNTSAPNEAQNTATTNFGVIPANYMQNQITQNQINFIPTNANKQIIQNVQTPRPAVTTTNVMNFQRNIEIQQNIPRTVVQQTFQHESNIQTSLPQSITMVPIQPTQPPQRTNDTHDQSTQIRPMQTLVANKPTIPPTVTTISNSTHERIVKKIAAVTPKGNITVNTLVNTVPKNVSSYSYRPIQPRPQQQRNIVPNIIPTNTQAQIKGPPKMQQPVTYNANPLTYLMTSNYTNTEQSMFNRKRKSESPDEVQKKMVSQIPQKGSPVAVVSSVQTNTVNSIGVNTMPMQKTHKMPANITRIPNMIRNEETIKEIQQRVETQMVKDTSSQSETEKLLRNTVFTQARNRVLADKQEMISTNTIKVETITSEIKTESILKKELEKEPVKIAEENKRDLVKKEEENKIELIKKEEESKKDLTNKEEEIKKEIVKKEEEIRKEIIKKEEEIRKDLIKKEEEIRKDIIKKEEAIRKDLFKKVEESKNVLVQKKEDKKELITKEEENKKDAPENETTKSVVVQKEEKIGKDPSNTLKPNIREINVLGNRQSNDKNSFVLTHVLDGYVIQESNIAFPIRRPLKEKTLLPNTNTVSVDKKESKEVKTETSTKIINLSNLNLNDVEEKKRVAEGEENKECTESDSKKDNPFAVLKTETVKSWTVKELTEHLVKYEWDETVTVLLEHEIDGESLYLVSKNQLVSIGISEEHADIICDFVKR
ncbi:PREDICTED: abnormal long morphology protein 1-like [Papilio polytes]|uniref:abnormal long morphology protein 1-like n=1 Tax=Papilio polytes TaxID=76194 RepID=UPI000675BDFD|nr:PREDICTED: abnormal long morphology protein 1-like [Papilio polytes]